MGHAIPVRTDYTAGEVRGLPSERNTLRRATDGAALVLPANLCGRTGYRTEFSNPSTISSITAATPGTRSSSGRGKSCPSRTAIGQPQVTQSEDWYYFRSLFVL